MENIIRPEELSSILEQQSSGKSEVLLLDVRRKADYAAEPAIIPGAAWQDPEEIEKWSKTIPESKQVVIYCVRGGSVSKSVSEYLNSRQIKTFYLEGGIKAWQESGGKVK